MREPERQRARPIRAVRPGRRPGTGTAARARLPPPPPPLPPGRTDRSPRRCRSPLRALARLDGKLGKMDRVSLAWIALLWLTGKRPFPPTPGTLPVFPQGGLSRCHPHGPRLCLGPPRRAAGGGGAACVSMMRGGGARKRGARTQGRRWTGRCLTRCKRGTVLLPSARFPVQTAALPEFAAPGEAWLDKTEAPRRLIN